MMESVILGNKWKQYEQKLELFTKCVIGFARTPQDLQGDWALTFQPMLAFDAEREKKLGKTGTAGHTMWAVMVPTNFGTRVENSCYDYRKAGCEGKFSDWRKESQ